MPRESQIQGAILKYLRSLPRVEAENVHGDAFQSGRPDINACVNGRLVRIEVKSPDHGNKSSDLQEADMRRWSKAGAICFVAKSVDDVKSIIYAHSKDATRIRECHELLCDYCCTNIDCDSVRR